MYRRVRLRGVLPVSSSSDPKGLSDWWNLAELDCRLESPWTVGISLGNHQPRVEAGGHAFWRRLRLIPFTHQVPEEKRIKDLSDQLVKEEGPAILAWIVKGARMALDGELVTPKRVLHATEEYEESEDRISQFLEDCTEDGTDEDSEPVGYVYQRYVEWCCVHRIKDVLEDSVFGRELSAKGFRRGRSNRVRRVHGLRLRPVGWEG